MEIPKREMLITHVARNFASLSGYRYGPDLLYANIPWYIGYRRNQNGSLGVHLFCGQAKKDKIWSVATNISIRLLSVNGNEWTRNASYTFTNDSVSGYGCHFHFKTLMEEYVVDDTLVFEVKATIEAMNGIEKPEKKRSFEATVGEPPDVIIQVADQKFYETKGHLVAQSPDYFKNLLKGEFKESNQDVVELKDVDPDVFHTFLELIHLEDSLNDDNVEDVLKLVDMYQSKGVGRLCEKFLIFESHLAMRTKFDISAKFKFEKLKTDCIRNMRTRADVRAVMGTDPSLLDPSICQVLLKKLITLR